jgi:exodeoxyribonuclease III
MLIASFNVNSVRMRLPVLREWLGKVSPDVVALQETKVQDHEFPQESFARMGYECVFRGQKSYNGVAILSRQRIEEVEYGLPSFAEATEGLGDPLTDAAEGLDSPPTKGAAGAAYESRDEARLIKAVVQGVTIVNTYVPQGVSPDSPQFQYKLDWFRRLRSYFQAKFDPARPVLWVGDLNIAPEDIDVYDPAALRGNVCFHPLVQQALRDVMAWGFTDLFRLHHPEAGQYSFYDYRVPNAIERGLGWRLDHLMGTAPLRDKCTSCTIDLEPRTMIKPSDHTCVVAQFDM